MGIPSPAADRLAQEPVGSGPFRLTEWVPQDHITLARNPDYAWAPAFAINRGVAHLDEIVFRILPEPSSRLGALETGAAQVIEHPPAHAARSLIDDGTFAVATFSAPGMASHMMLNVDKDPTDELAVRQAMNYAVDQAQLAETAFAGLQSPAHSVLSPATVGYDRGAADLYRFDRARAESLLEQAGWFDSDADGIREKDGQTLAIVYPALPAYEAEFMHLLANYLTDVGFAVEILEMDNAGVFAFANAGRHNMVNMGWISHNPAVLDLVYNSANIEAGSAFARFRSAELDEVLSRAAGELDPALRDSLYAQAQLIIMENALALPIHNYDRVMLMAPTVDGWRFDAEGYPYLSEVSLAR
jgi:peptide/nickel transport system substrate-binding protein